MIYIFIHICLHILHKIYTGDISQSITFFFHVTTNLNESLLIRNNLHSFVFLFIVYDICVCLQVSRHHQGESSFLLPHRFKGLHKGSD